MSGNVSVRRHTRRRTGRSAEIARRLGLPDTVTVAGFERRRPAAVPRWTRLGANTFLGRYKDRRLAVVRQPIEAERPGWYWEVTDRKAGLLASGVAPTAGDASRRAELAAGYEFAGEVLRAGMAFLDPTERPE